MSWYFLLLLVSGCYFSSGGTIEPTAYLSKGDWSGFTESIEIRGHIPFDFTVHQQDSMFKIWSVPSLVGVLVNLKLPDPNSLKKVVKIYQVFRLVATEEPTKPCEERKHCGSKRS
jgi:hypothetical protein